MALATPDPLNDASRFADSLESAGYGNKAVLLRDCFEAAGTRLELFMMIKFTLSELITEGAMPELLQRRAQLILIEFEKALDVK